jgi:hypothetical protein
MRSQQSPLISRWLTVRIVEHMIYFDPERRGAVRDRCRSGALAAAERFLVVDATPSFDDSFLAVAGAATA